MSNLPPEKIKKLSDKFAGEVVEKIGQAYKDLRKHDVSPGDAAIVIREGFRKAGNSPTPTDVTP